MAEMKTLNGYEVVDAKAREDIANIKLPTVPTKVSELDNDAGYATEQYVNDAISGIDVSGGSAYYFDLTYAKADWSEAPQSVADAANALLASGVTETVVYARAVFGTYDTAAAVVNKSSSRTYISIYTNEKLKVNADKSATNYTSTFTIEPSSASTGWSYKKTETSNVLVTTTYITNKGFATASEVQTLINNSLGVIENGTY
jgi:hypothetical protein